MAVRQLPSTGELRQLLRYEPDTGKLFWLSRPLRMFKSGKLTARHKWLLWNSRFAGTEALTATNKGYRVGAINRQNVCAHRVAWAIMTGEWPDQEIDHINRNRSDNRWDNLRAVDHAENAHNLPLMGSNTSGVCGVSWHQRAGKWRAQINLDDRQRHLGLFTDKADAIAARRAAEIKFGFHPNHGKAA